MFYFNKFWMKFSFFWDCYIYSIFFTALFSISKFPPPKKTFLFPLIIWIVKNVWLRLHPLVMVWRLSQIKRKHRTNIRKKPPKDLTVQNSIRHQSEKRSVWDVTPGWSLVPWPASCSYFLTHYRRWCKFCMWTEVNQACLNYSSKGKDHICSDELRQRHKKTWRK